MLKWVPGEDDVLARNSKGCDFGYALAADSCEGVNSVDACTVTAFGAITAFAVPNPGGHLATPSVFSGLAVPSGHPREPITQLTSGQPRLRLPALFCRRHVRSYSSMRNCQRRRLVQMHFIFLWESICPIRRKYAGYFCCRTSVRNKFTCFSQKMGGPNGAFWGEPFLPLDESRPLPHLS